MTRRSNSNKPARPGRLLDPDHGGGNVLARANSATSAARFIAQQIESRQAEERARIESEARAKKEAVERARIESEARARRVAEDKARREAAESARRVAEVRKRRAPDAIEPLLSKRSRTSETPAHFSSVLAGIGKNVAEEKSHEPLPAPEPPNLGSFLSQSGALLSSLSSVWSSGWSRLTTKLLQEQNLNQPSTSIGTNPPLQLATPTAPTQIKVNKELIFAFKNYSKPTNYEQFNLYYQACDFLRSSPQNFAAFKEDLEKDLEEDLEKINSIIEEKQVKWRESEILKRAEDVYNLRINSKGENEYEKSKLLKRKILEDELNIERQKNEEEARGKEKRKSKATSIQNWEPPPIQLPPEDERWSVNKIKSMQNSADPLASTKTQNTTIDICDFALYYFYIKPELKSDNETIKTWAEIDQKKRKEVKLEWDSLTHDQKDEFKFSLFLRLSKTNNSDLEDEKLKWQYLSDDQRNIFKGKYQQISQKFAQKALGKIVINPIDVSRPEVVERVQVPMFSSDYSKKPTDTHFLYLSSLYRDFNDNENNFNIKKIIFPPKPFNVRDRGKNPYLDERIVKWGRELSKFGIDREGAEFKENYLKNYSDYLIENIALLQSQQQISDQTQDQDRKNKLKTLVAFHYLELSKMLYSGTYGTYTSVDEKSSNSSQQPTSRINDIIESIPYMYRESLNFGDRIPIYRDRPMRTISAHGSIHLPDPAQAEQKELFRLANGKVLKTYIPVSLSPMGGDGNWEHYQMHKLGNMSKWELLLDGKFNTLLRRVADPVVNPYDDRDYGNAYSKSEQDSYLLSLEAEKFRNKSYLPHYLQSKISMVLTGKESKDAALERAIGGQPSNQVQPLPSLLSWAHAMWAEKNISPKEHSDREERYKLQMMSPIQPPTNTCSRRVPTSRDKYVQDTEIVRRFEGAAKAVFSSFGGGRQS